MLLFGFLSFTVLLIYIFINKFYSTTVSFGEFNLQATQTLRGLMILFVLVGHICNFVLDKDDSFLVSNIAMWGNIAVCMFFFISGYGLMFSYKLKGHEYLNDFLHKRLCKIFVPLIIATIVFLPINYLNGETTLNIIINYTKGIPSLRFSWFCYTISIFYIAFWWIARAVKSHNKIILLTIACCVLYGMTLKLIGWKEHWYASTLSIPLGMFFCNNENTLRRIIVQHSFLWFIVMLLFFFITYVSGVIGLSYYTISICIPLLLYTLTLFFRTEHSRFKLVHLVDKVLGSLGKISYEIYLCHGVFITIISRLELSTYYSIISMMVAFPILLGLSYCLKKIEKTLTSRLS